MVGGSRGSKIEMLHEAVMMKTFQWLPSAVRSQGQGSSETSTTNRVSGVLFVFNKHAY